MLEQELFENIPTGMGVFDVTGDVIEMKYLNDGYYQMIQASREMRKQYFGVHTIQAMHQDDRAGLLKEAHDAIRESRMFQYRFRVLSGTGAYLWISIRANHKPVDGRTERFYAVYYNVDTYMSERIQLSSILNNIPGGAAIFSDHNGKIRLDYTNDGFYGIHHGSREYWASISSNPVDWLVPSDRHLFEEEFALVRDGKKSLGNAAYCVIGEDGKQHWVNNLFRSAYELDGTQYYYSSFTGLDELKATEAERRKADLMYEAAVEDAKLVVWEYDIVKHTITMAENDFTKYDYRKFNLPKTLENIPQSLIPYIDDNYVDQFLAMYTAIEQGAPNASCEVWYKLKPGTEPRCEHIRYVTIFDDNGKPVKAYGIGQNITALKLEHEKYTSLYKQVTATLSDAISSTRLNLSKNSYISGYSADPGVVERLQRTTANEHFLAAIQSIPDEAIRTRLTKIFTCENLITLYKQGHTQVTESYPVLTSKNATLWISTTLYLLQNPETGDIEALTYAKDITKLRKDEEIIRHLAEETCDFIGIIDTEIGTFTLYDGMWACDGLERDEPVPFEQGREMLISHYVLTEERQRFTAVTSLEAIRHALSTSKQYTLSYTFVENDVQQKKQIRFSALGRSGRELLVVQNDITESSQREQRQIDRLQEALVEAEKANTAKSEFVSRISHDIRTPISIISSMTRFAQEDYADQDKLLSDLRKIESSNTFLLSLINDVLDISKIDSGKIELHPAPYLYADYISNIRNMFDPLCKQKHISFIIADSPGSVKISVDQTRLNQITLNLISNAVKYTPEGGTITFSSKSVDTDDGKAMCTITVKDTGIGMSKSFQKVMFEPFTQEYDNPERDKTAIGTGLGLSIVKKIINLMKGTITVNSELGKGTEICVQIPIIRADGDDGTIDISTSSTYAEVQQKQLSGTLLLAEDNILNTEIAERILETLGFTTVHAENGEKAVALFAVSDPGTFKAILMDIQMPVMNGYDAATAIRSLQRADAQTVPIIAMTADAFSAALEHSKAVGMNDYVTKPIDPDRLRTVLEKYCQ
jgi:signal transduction histidine kinase/ActR/RegA family two-component response regulator